MPDVPPDAALFAALVAARPLPAPAPLPELTEQILRLAAAIREGNALLREAAAELAAGRGIARLPALLARAETASQEQSECARGLMEALVGTGRHRAA